MMPWRTLGLSLVLLLAGTATLAAVTQGFRSYTYQTALETRVSRHPRPLPGVMLQDQSGRYVGLRDFQGQWLLVDFIYTRCLTVCSTQGALFAQLAHDLKGPIAQGQVQLLSISFDPRHDDPSALARYRARFATPDAFPGWRMLRPADSQALTAIRQTFGLKVIADGLGGYEHNAAIHIVDPQGRLVSIQPWDAPESALQFLHQHLAS